MAWKFPPNVCETYFGWNICWRIDLCRSEPLNCQVWKLKGQIALKCAVKFAFPKINFAQSFESLEIAF